MPNRRPGENPLLPDESVNDYTNKVHFRYFKDSALFDVLTTAWRSKKDEELKKISVIFNNLREYVDTYIELEDAYFRHYFAYYKHAKQVYIDFYDKEVDSWIVETNFEETLFVKCNEIESDRYASYERAPIVCSEAMKFENAKQQIVSFDNMFNTLLSQIGLSYPVYNKELISPTSMTMETVDGKASLFDNLQFYSTKETLNLWEQDPTPETELTEEDIMQILNENQDTSIALPSHLLSMEKISAVITSALSILVWENKKLFFHGSSAVNTGLSMSWSARSAWSTEDSLVPVNFNKVDGYDLRNFWISDNDLKTMFIQSSHSAHLDPEKQYHGSGFSADNQRHLFQLGGTLSKGSPGWTRLKTQVFNDWETYGGKYHDDVLEPFFENDVKPNVWTETDAEGQFISNHNFAYGSHLVGHHLDALTKLENIDAPGSGIRLHEAIGAEFKKYLDFIHENWLSGPTQKDYVETIPDFRTFLQTTFSADKITFFDMENIGDHSKIADFWTSKWYRPFVVKRRNDYYPHMWASHGNPAYRSSAKKFWEFADLRYEPFFEGGSTDLSKGLRSEIVLDHVAWYYPKLAAVITEIIYKIHNIALHTTCIDVKEQQINDSQWEVTINIKHMPYGYDKIVYPEDFWYEKYAGKKFQDVSKFWNIKGYEYQPKVNKLPPVKFLVNKKAIRNDLNERNFVFD